MLTIHPAVADHSAIAKAWERLMISREDKTSAYHAGRYIASEMVMMWQSSYDMSVATSFKNFNFMQT